MSAVWVASVGVVASSISCAASAASRCTQLGRQSAAIRARRGHAPQSEHDQRDQRPAVAQRRVLCREHQRELRPRKHRLEEPARRQGRQGRQGRRPGGFAEVDRRHFIQRHEAVIGGEPDPVADRGRRRGSPGAGASFPPGRPVGGRVQAVARRDETRGLAAAGERPRGRPIADAFGGLVPAPGPGAVAREGEREPVAHGEGGATPIEHRAHRAVGPDLDHRVVGRDQRALIVHDRQRARAGDHSGHDPERAATVGRSPQQIVGRGRDGAADRRHRDHVTARQRDARARAVASPVEASRRGDPDVIRRRRRGQRVGHDRRTRRTRRRAGPSPGRQPFGGQHLFGFRCLEVVIGKPGQAKQLLGVDRPDGQRRLPRRRRRFEARAARDLAPAGVERDDRVCAQGEQLARAGDEARDPFRRRGADPRRRRERQRDREGEHHHRSSGGRTSCALCPATVVPARRRGVRGAHVPTVVAARRQPDACAGNRPPRVVL